MDQDIMKTSRVDVAYVYVRLAGILDSRDMAYAASRFLDELAYNFEVDTGYKIGEMLAEKGSER